MNREQTKGAIELLQAFVDGKTIQQHDRFPGGKLINDVHAQDWFDCDDPQWNFKNTLYRIKPEPREWWVYDDGAQLIIECDGPPGERHGSWVKVREVLDE